MKVNGVNFENLKHDDQEAVLNDAIKYDLYDAETIAYMLNYLKTHKE